MAKHLVRLYTIGALLLVGTARGWAGPGDIDAHFGSGGRLQGSGIVLMVLRTIAS
jgi:hypothetical protein